MIINVDRDYPKTSFVDLQEFGTMEVIDDGLARPLDLDVLDATLNGLTVTADEVESALMDPALDDVVLPFTFDEE